MRQNKALIRLLIFKMKEICWLYFFVRHCTFKTNLETIYTMHKLNSKSAFYRTHHVHSFMNALYICLHISNKQTFLLRKGACRTQHKRRNNNREKTVTIYQNLTSTSVNICQFDCALDYSSPARWLASRRFSDRVGTPGRPQRYHVCT